MWVSACEIIQFACLLASPITNPVNHTVTWWGADLSHTLVAKNKRKIRRKQKKRLIFDIHIVCVWYFARWESEKSEEEKMRIRHLTLWCVRVIIIDNKSAKSWKFSIEFLLGVLKLAEKFKIWAGKLTEICYHDHHNNDHNIIIKRRMSSKIVLFRWKYANSSVPSLRPLLTTFSHCCVFLETRIITFS